MGLGDDYFDPTGAEGPDTGQRGALIAIQDECFRETGQNARFLFYSIENRITPAIVYWLRGYAPAG